MKKLDRYERGILNAYEKGVLVSARTTKAQRESFREAARATFLKSRRVNIRLSASDPWIFKPKRTKRAFRTRR